MDSVPLKVKHGVQVEESALNTGEVMSNRCVRMPCSHPEHTCKEKEGKGKDQQRDKDCQVMTNRLTQSPHYIISTNDVSIYLTIPYTATLQIETLHLRE